MTAVTRTIRGARRTGQRFGCAHPKCRCGFYSCASRRSASPYFFGGKGFVQWLGKARAQKTRRENEIAHPCSPSSPASGGATAASLEGCGPRRLGLHPSRPARSLSSGRPLRAGPVGAGTSGGGVEGCVVLFSPAAILPPFAR